MTQLGFEKTSLWKTSLGDAAYKDEKEARNFLREQLLNTRNRVEHLVSLIRRDMPLMTVHDVTHLDALWETANLIAGKSYPLNPAEAFVFGTAVLLHDSAMSLAAYPGGLEEIQATPEWRDAVADHLQPKTDKLSEPIKLDALPESVAKAALQDVLREFHAKRALELPFLEWPVPGGGKEFLIQNGELRAAYGNIIGLVASSHWWPTPELSRLPPRVNAGPNVPADWHINPLKVACLLRVADAAHIDHRRAPRFLRALIKPIGYSELHWAFQMKLAKPSIDKSSLVYTGGPFDVEEVEAWWLCYDMLSMIDDELRAVQAELDSHGIKPFLATGVKGAKSPRAVSKLITTSHWEPVNTELKVSDVPALVELLGGERLYGSDLTVPLRELIQNAADAVRARRLLSEPSVKSGFIRVRLRKDGGTHWLDVEDDGLGMSRAVLTGALLDFGRSFWRSGSVRREFPGLLSKGLKLTGRYGIGFFSVFMLGDRVTVTTRRYDAAVSDTYTLDFTRGLRVRPILREPVSSETLPQSGTRVCVQLRIPPEEPGGLLYRGSTPSGKSLASLQDLVGLVCPALDVSVEVEETEEPAIAFAADNWLAGDAEMVLLRAAGASGEFFKHDIQALKPFVRELKDSGTGAIHGRACISPGDSVFSVHGVVTVGGFRATGLAGIAGVLTGEPRTVARDSAMPTVPAAVLRAWATEQAQLIGHSDLPPAKRLHAAGLVMMLGGDASPLPIAIRNGDYLTAGMIQEIVRGASEAQVYHGKELDYDEDDNVLPKNFNNDLVVEESLFFVPQDCSAILRLSELLWPQCLLDLYIPGCPKNYQEAFERALTTAWGRQSERDLDSRVVGKVYEEDIYRDVSIYVPPLDLSDYT